MSTTLLATPVSLSLTGVTAATWSAISLSGTVPAGTTGVILNATASGGANATYYGARMSGSTDAYIGGQTTSPYNQKQLITGLRSSDLSFDFYSQAVGTGVLLYLLGYFGAEATFYSAAVDGGLVLQGSYGDIDVSSIVPVGTQAVITTLSSHALTALRQRGSTDDWYTTAGGGIAQMIGGAIIGLDSSRMLNGKTANSGIHLRLLGYITSGLTWNTNAIDRTPGTTGSYQSLTTTSGATGYLYHLAETSNVNVSVVTSGGTAPYQFATAMSAGQMCAGTPPTAKVASSVPHIYEQGYFSLASTTYPGVMTELTKGRFRPQHLWGRLF